MENKINNASLEQKDTAEEREFERLSKTKEKVSDGNSKFFYVCLILFNILTLGLCYVILNKISTVEKLSIVFESLDYKIYILLLMSFLLVLFLKTLPMFLKIYSKTKNRNLFTALAATIVGEYYGRVTICSCGELPMCSNYLTSKGYTSKNIVDVNYGIKFFDKISLLIYGVIIYFVGSFIALQKINVWLFVLGILILFYYIAQILIVFMFKNNKKKTLESLSKFVKVLYSLHLIKDYEKLYYKLIDRLIIYVKELRENKWLIFTEIIANVFRYFLESIVIYFVVVTLNFASASVLGELLLATLILDLILQIWPLKYGTFIYEILFVILFINLFFDGFVFWGLLVYRIFDYFLFALVYLIWGICSTIKRKIVYKSKMKQ